MSQTRNDYVSVGVSSQRPLWRAPAKPIQGEQSFHGDRTRQVVLSSLAARYAIPKMRKSPSMMPLIVPRMKAIFAVARTMSS